MAALVAACSAEDLLGDVRLDIDDGASDGEKQVVKVDGTHEVSLMLDTGAALTFSKGAVDGKVEIGMERPNDTKALGFVKTLKNVNAVASAPYVLTPHGTTFKGAVTLELPLSKAQPRNLVVGYLEDEDDHVWKLLGKPTVEGEVAKIALKHFSVVVLLDGDRAGLSQANDADEPDGDTYDDERDDAGTSPEADAGQSEARADAGTSGGSSDGVADAGVRVPAADAGTGEPPVSAYPDGSVSGVADAGLPAYDANIDDGGSLTGYDGGGTVSDGSVGALPDASDADADSNDDDAGYDSGTTPPYDAGPTRYDAGTTGYDAGSVAAVRDAGSFKI